jgi:oligoendopeptidase F
MNAMRDYDGRFTRVHEAGHGIHHYLTRHLSVGSFRDCPFEIMEIASMSMELFTIDDLHTIGLSDSQIKDGIYKKIIYDIGFFPYMSKIDLFQQRMYDHPSHTSQERTSERKRLNKLYPYSVRTQDTSVWIAEYQDYIDTYRQRQMHLFEAPFYYIEYGIAQLASLQLYNQFLIDRPSAIQNYKKILSA